MYNFKKIKIKISDNQVEWVEKTDLQMKKDLSQLYICIHLNDI